MKMNKLYLFYPSTLIGWIISLVTRSPFCHAAIEVDGVLYDSSESRGNFGRSEIDPSQRKHVCVQFPGYLGSWLSTMRNREYDWVGVIGWLFSANSRRRFYCFETAWLALSHAQIVRGAMPLQLSGSDLLIAISNYLQRAPQGMAIGSALQILYAVNYEHIDRVSQLLATDDGDRLAHSIIEAALTHTETDNLFAALEAMQADKAKLIAVEERLYLLAHCIHGEEPASVA